MTDNPTHAATYVKNGGQVVEITIPRSTYLQMQHNLQVQTYRGFHGASYRIEYRFNPEIVPQIIRHFKY